ncbi:MAG: DUF177 domain-containing protein [Dehalococcoidia bacterium]|jgi:uncharacterized protein|nr:MAG: DUF177 domain-containing protein [Dehalococcoidia bacterium]
MLTINVAQQLKESIGAEREYELSGRVDIDGKESTVEGQVKLTRTDRGIVVEAHVTGKMKIACSRCLAEFDHPLSLNFEEEYLQTVDMASGGKLSLPGDCGNFTTDARHNLDLSEAVRQYALLSVPIKPLCRKKCAGLCPHCGQNLNQGQCQCPSAQVDPRWAPLLELKDKLKGKG